MLSTALYPRLQAASHDERRLGILIGRKVTILRSIRDAEQCDSVAMLAGLPGGGYRSICEFQASVAGVLFAP